MCLVSVNKRKQYNLPNIHVGLFQCVPLNAVKLLINSKFYLSSLNMECAYLEYNNLV